MAMRNAKMPVQCEICGKTVLKKGLNKHIDMAHGDGQKYAFSSVGNSSDFKNGYQKRVNEIEVIPDNVEEKGVSEMGETCVNCLFKDRDIKDLTKETERIKADAETREKELTEKLTAANKALAEKPEPKAADAIPEDLESVIAHCEDGSCAAHSRQWQTIRRRVVEANKPAIIQATLENLPDSVVEQEGLRRGFIPKKIIIPVSIKAKW